MGQLYRWVITKKLQLSNVILSTLSEYRIQQQKTDDMQFGFPPGKGTTDAICGKASK